MSILKDFQGYEAQEKVSAWFARLLLTANKTDHGQGVLMTPISEQAF